MRHKEAGMTLVELLIVIAIMGLVATIAVPIYRGAIDKSHRATLVHDAGELYRAFMRYNVDKGYFPSTANPVERKFDVETLAPLSTEQYFRTVRPMHEAHVEPSAAFAQLLLDGTAPPHQLVEAVLKGLGEASAVHR